MLPRFISILSAVGRLWTLRRPRGDHLRGRDAVIALLAGVGLAEFTLIDRYAPGSAAQFYPDGVLTLATDVMAALAAAWLLSRCSRPRPAFADALLLVAGVSPVAIGIVALIDYGLPARWGLAAGAGLAMYLLLYLRRGLFALTGGSQWRAVAVLAVALAAFLWLIDSRGWSPSLWSEPSAGAVTADDAGDDTETRERGEELLFDQPERIDAALAAVADSNDSRIPSAEGRKPQLYFLGFAGVAEERVFAEEIALAQRRIDDRYGITNHSLLLLNDRRDLDSAPLATVSGLERALDGIGAKMDRERDVLFIALSSHGSRQPDLAVSNGALPLLQLTPDDLKQALNAAGIRWKVIVVSSCYAGAFVAPLRDTHTIIITAAAADRTSFGCSNDRSLTYFGEAFYRDALPGAVSLRQAFDTAKRAIEKREQAENIDASQPTAFFGRQMEAKLAGMERAR